MIFHCLASFFRELYWSLPILKSQCLFGSSVEMIFYSQEGEYLPISLSAEVHSEKEKDFYYQVHF